MFKYIPHSLPSSSFPISPKPLVSFSLSQNSLSLSDASMCMDKGLPAGTGVNSKGVTVLKKIGTLPLTAAINCQYLFGESGLLDPLPPSTLGFCLT